MVRLCQRSSLLTALDRAPCHDYVLNRRLLCPRQHCDHVLLEGVVGKVGPNVHQLAGLPLHRNNEKESESRADKAKCKCRISRQPGSLKPSEVRGLAARAERHTSYL